MCDKIREALSLSLLQPREGMTNNSTRFHSLNTQFVSHIVNKMADKGTPSPHANSSFLCGLSQSTANKSEPTPAEEAAARAKEAEEQAALPYKWTQTISELDVVVSVPGNLKARDLVVELKRDSLRVGAKGQDPVIDVSFG